MAKPSLKASPEGVITARAALQRAGLTQQALRAQVGCSRQPITNFFKGAAIAQPLFVSVCEQLGLDWQAIADLPDSPAPVRPSAKAPSNSPGHRPVETATLLTEKPSSHGNAAKNAAQAAAQNQNRLIDSAQIRAQVQDYTLQRCQSLTLLGRARGRQFEAIAPQLKILHSSDLYDLAPQQSEGGSEQNTAETSPVLSGSEAVSRYPYLHLLGPPGAGKSTFLRYLALQCIRGELAPQRVPIFIALREIADSLSHKSLFEAIAQVYQRTCNLDPQVLSQLFQQGDVLLLLDGEDEIAEDLSKQLVLTNFNLFYRNQVVISCRTAAHQRLHQDFVQTTLEPFDHDQIQAFLDQWFEHSSKTKAGFLDWLSQIQTDSRQSYELAETPLLLTLLCITFENSSSLPQGKLQIYELAFESLLDDWNANHMTPWRSKFEQRSHGEKMRILKAIASAGFSQPEKRFSATRRFINNKAGLTAEDLDNLSAKDFLNDIERLYGLIQQEGWNSYRFSHLSFHEYLMALSVLEQLEQCDHAEALFQDLLKQHCFASDWYEVFCFVIEGLPTSQALPALALMADQLQDYLAQQNAIAQTQVEAGREVADALIQLYQSNPHSPSAAKQALAHSPSESALVIRAFSTDYHYQFDLGRRISHALKLDYAFNHDLVLAHCFKCNLNQTTKDKLKVGDTFVFSDALTHVWKSPDLHRAIQAVETVTEVRDLFFNYVLQHPELFREEVCDRFTDYAQSHDYPHPSEASSNPIHPLAHLHPRLRQAISKLVGAVSRPDQERHPFLQTKQLQFPIAAYDNPEAVQALQNYYQGCTLLCDALRTRSDISREQRELLLQKLF